MTSLFEQASRYQIKAQYNLFSACKSYTVTVHENANTNFYFLFFLFSLQIKQNINKRSTNYNHIDQFIRSISEMAMDPDPDLSDPDLRPFLNFGSGYQFPDFPDPDLDPDLTFCQTCSD